MTAPQGFRMQWVLSRDIPQSRGQRGLPEKMMLQGKAEGWVQVGQLNEGSDTPGKGNSTCKVIEPRRSSSSLRNWKETRVTKAQRPKMEGKDMKTGPTEGRHCFQKHSSVMALVIVNIHTRPHAHALEYSWYLQILDLNKRRVQMMNFFSPSVPLPPSILLDHNPTF